jgi:hypothetical protein
MISDNSIHISIKPVVCSSKAPRHDETDTATMTTPRRTGKSESDLPHKNTGFATDSATIVRKPGYNI